MERPRWRSRSASSLSDMQVEGEQSEKIPKPPTAFEKIAQQETRKEMHVLEQKMNQHALEQKRKTQEPAGTHHRKSKEDRKQDGSNEGSHPTDGIDAAENRDDVPAILRRSWWEVESGHVVDQFMDGKTKTEEHTQLQGTRGNAVTNSARGEKTNSRKSRNVQTSKRVSLV